MKGGGGLMSCLYNGDIVLGCPGRRGEGAAGLGHVCSCDIVLSATLTKVIVRQVICALWSA